MATVPSIGRAAPAPGAPAEATRDLYERFGRQIFAYCLMQLRNREEAEDAVQSTFLNAFRALERGVVPELESAWLYKIAQHVCLTRHRSSTRRRRVESTDDFDSVQEFMGAPIRDTEEVGELTEALRALPEQQRRAILLREWQGLTYKEIASEMELSQAAIETLIFRARRGLAQTLEKLRASGDMSSLFTAIKSILVGFGTKAAVTIVTVATTSVVAATPEARHGVIHFVDHSLQQTHLVVVPTKPDRPSQDTAKPTVSGSSAVASIPAVHGPLTAPHDAQPPLHEMRPLTNNVKHTVVTVAPLKDVTPAQTKTDKATTTPAATPAASASSSDEPIATPTATTPAAAATPATTKPAATASTSGDSRTPAPSAQAPSVNGFTPQSGAAGTIVQLIGKSFTGATSVRFNGTSADFKVTSDTQITTKVPSDATSGQITIATANGTVTTDGSFTVTAPPSSPSSGSGSTSGTTTAPPSLNTFSPSSAAPGATVYLGGRNFTGATSVKFNGTAAEFTVTSDGNYITTRVPSGATSGPITVVTPNGSVTSSSNFTVNAVSTAPTFNGMSPSSGGVGASVGIGGKNFTGATSVKFNGTTADFTVSSDTLITTHVPTGATTGPITIVTPNGSVTSSSNFTVTAGSPPSISGTSPTSGTVGTTVTISGLYFTGATYVRFNGTNADFTVNSDTSITTHVPSGATTGTIVVITPNGYTNSGTFTVTSSTPSIEGASPSSGTVGATVTIGGHNFTGATSVKFNGVAATFTVTSDTQISATVPSGATTGPLSVTTPNGTATSSGSFTVTAPAAPTISGFSPSSGAVGATIGIGGTHFTGATSVKFNGVSASFTVSNDGVIQAVVPAGATSGQVTVTTPNGTATGSGSFTVTH